MLSGIWYAFALRLAAGFLFGAFDATAAFDVDAFGMIALLSVLNTPQNNDNNEIKWN